jgi:hypothetical protein
VEDVFLASLQRAIHISSLRRKVACQNEALERYARSFEERDSGSCLCCCY